MMIIKTVCVLTLVRRIKIYIFSFHDDTHSAGRSFPQKYKKLRRRQVRSNDDDDVDDDDNRIVPRRNFRRGNRE